MHCERSVSCEIIVHLAGHTAIECLLKIQAADNSGFNLTMLKFNSMAMLTHIR